MPRKPKTKPKNVDDIHQEIVITLLQGILDELRKLNLNLEKRSHLQVNSSSNNSRLSSSSFDLPAPLSPQPPFLTAPLSSIEEGGGRGEDLGNNGGDDDHDDEEFDDDDDDDSSEELEYFE